MFGLTPWRRREGEIVPAGWPSAFRKELDDLLKRFFGEEHMLPSLRGRFAPAVDLSETDKEVVIKAEIPGIDPKNLEVSLAGDILTIKGEKKEEKEEKGEGFRSIERSFGSFSRSFTLPCKVNEDKIESKYKDGVLTLNLPKTEVVKKKAIQIDVQ
ncbi:MAG: Hsp20/alpha crystallin family protein [Desulfomonilaceae bacterium]